MAFRLGWSFQEKWVCASTRPGINVAPAASMVCTPAGGVVRAPRATRRMRLPWTSTSPVYGCAPLPSKMRTLVNRMFAMLGSSRYRVIGHAAGHRFRILRRLDRWTMLIVAAQLKTQGPK